MSGKQLVMVVLRSLVGVMVTAPSIAVSQDRDGGHGAVDLPQIVFGEMDLDRADVLLQALDLAAARNRNNPFCDSSSAEAVFRLIWLLPGLFLCWGFLLFSGDGSGQRTFRHQPTLWSGLHPTVTGGVQG